MPVTYDFFEAGKTINNAKPGDIVLCHGNHVVSSFIEWGERIRFKGGSRWSHTCYVETRFDVIEALAKSVVRSPITKYDDIPKIVVHTGMDLSDIAQATAFAQSCLGQQYGWLTDAAIGARFLTPGHGLWLGLNGTEICSGLCAQCLVRGWFNFSLNPAAMSPAELAIDLHVPASLAEIGSA